MGSDFLEYLGWFILSTAKFIITPSSMIAAGYSWLSTIITVAISSSIGFCAFYFFGDVVFNSLAKLRKSPAKKFSSMNRKIVGIKMKYGILGMALISVIVSVPIAGLMSAKFFRNPKVALPSMILAFTTWTFILTSVSWLIRNVIHG